MNVDKGLLELKYECIPELEQFATWWSFQRSKTLEFEKQCQQVDLAREFTGLDGQRILVECRSWS